MIYTRFVGNYLALDQALSSNIKAFVVEHFLSLTDSVSQNLSGQTLSNSLNLAQVVRVAKTLNLAVSNSIAFTQYTHPRAIFQSVSQILVIAQEAVAVDNWPLISQALVITQLAVVDKSKGTSNSLSLSQEVSVQKSIGLQVESSLILLDDVTVYKPSIFFINGEGS